MKKSKFWLFNVQYNEPARSVEQNEKITSVPWLIIITFIILNVFARTTLNNDL